MASARPAALIILSALLLSTPAYASGNEGLSWVSLLMGLIGGLGLFLFGIEYMSHGLQKTAGESLRRVLGKMTHNQYIAAGAGAAAVALIHSSGAVAVMMVGFVNSKLMNVRQTLGVLLGAAVGTTLTAQLFAFKITEYSLIFVGIGALMYVFSRQEHARSLAESILGFGIVFFGMHLMSQAMLPLKGSLEVLELLSGIQNPYLGVLIGAAITAVLQSGSAFIGIVMIFSAQGLLEPETALGMMLGSNLGIPMPALLASFKASREAKKVAYAQLSYKIMLVAAFVLLIPALAKLMNYFSFGSLSAPSKALQYEYLPRQIANAYALINIVLLVVGLPLVPMMERFVHFAFGKQKTKQAAQNWGKLDPALLDMPSLAMSVAKQEAYQLGQAIARIHRLSLTLFVNGTQKDIQEISRQRYHCKQKQDNLRNFLLLLSQRGQTGVGAKEAYRLFYALNELTHINDELTKAIVAQAEKWIERGYVFTAIQKSEIEAYHRNCAQLFESAVDLLHERNPSKASQSVTLYESLKNDAQQLEHIHYTRLLDPESPEAANSKVHLGLINALSVVNMHTKNIAKIFQ